VQIGKLDQADRRYVDLGRDTFVSRGKAPLKSGMGYDIILGNGTDCGLNGSKKKYLGKKGNTHRKCNRWRSPKNGRNDLSHLKMGKSPIPGCSKNLAPVFGRKHCWKQIAHSRAAQSACQFRLAENSAQRSACWQIPRTIIAGNTLRSLIAGARSFALSPNS